MHRPRSSRRCARRSPSRATPSSSTRSTRFAISVSLEALKAALDELDEPTSCEGTYTLDEKLAVMLPDGDVGALGDPQFVEWLLAHAELAPFGDGFETRVDPGVRNVQRVIG